MSEKKVKVCKRCKKLKVITCFEKYHQRNKNRMVNCTTCVQEKKALKEARFGLGKNEKTHYWNPDLIYC